MVARLDRSILVAILADLLGRTHFLEVRSHALEGHLPPQLEDPTPGVAVLKRLRQLYRLLRGAQGPYR